MVISSQDPPELLTCSREQRIRIRAAADLEVDGRGRRRRGGEGRCDVAAERGMAWPGARRRGEGKAASSGASHHEERERERERQRDDDGGAEEKRGKRNCRREEEARWRSGQTTAAVLVSTWAAGRWAVRGAEERRLWWRSSGTAATSRSWVRERRNMRSGGSGRMAAVEDGENLGKREEPCERERRTSVLCAAGERMAADRQWSGKGSGATTGYGGGRFERSGKRRGEGQRRVAVTARMGDDGGGGGGWLGFFPEEGEEVWERREPFGRES